MTESLDTSLRWFWVSAALAILFIALLWLVTRRDLWLRYVAAEAAFWARLRVPARFVEASRRFEASRAFVLFLWLVVVLWFLLALANGAAYMYFKSQIPPLRKVPAIDLPVPPSAESATE